MEICLSKALEICDYRTLDPGRFAAPFTMDEEALKVSLERLRSRRGKITETDRVEKDDFVRLDCESDTPGYQKKDLDVRVGRGLFSPELEQGILGMAAGETRTLDLPAAAVKVTVRSISRRILPPLTDEAAASWGMEGVSTVDDLIRSVKEAARDRYIEDTAEAVAVELSGLVNAGSRFKLDPGEIGAVCAEGRRMAEDMLRSAGLDPETADDEAVRSVTGRTKQEHYDFLRLLFIEELKSAAVGAVYMEQEGAEVTREQYRKAVLECSEGMGLTEEEAGKILTWPRFLRQTAATYLFEKIIDYVINYLKQEELS